MALAMTRMIFRKNFAGIAGSPTVFHVRNNTHHDFARRTLQGAKEIPVRGIHADGTKIKQLRKTRGLTQENLAGLASCDVKTVRKAEQGKNLDYQTLGKIATVLGVHFPEVVDGRDDPDSEQLANFKLVESWIEAFNQRDIDRLMSSSDDKETN